MESQTLKREDVARWKMLRAFIIAGGSPTDRHVVQFLQKYGATNLGVFLRLPGPSELPDTNETLSKLGMIEWSLDVLFANIFVQNLVFLN